MLPPMRPIIFSADTPRSIDDFSIDWRRAVVADAGIEEARHPYLGAIARYSTRRPSGR